MSASDWGLTLIWIGGIAATSFVLLYGFTRLWWSSWIGRALIMSSLGLTLLFDLSLYVHYHPFDLTQTQANCVVGVAVLGACLKLFALLIDVRHAGWRRRP